MVDTVLNICCCVVLVVLGLAGFTCWRDGMRCLYAEERRNVWLLLPVVAAVCCGAAHFLGMYVVDWVGDLFDTITPVPVFDREMFRPYMLPQAAVVSLLVWLVFGPLGADWINWLWILPVAGVAGAASGLLLFLILAVLFIALLILAAKIGLVVIRCILYFMLLFGDTETC